jgi:uncharacterized repeat protein (TIGR03803 family)
MKVKSASATAKRVAITAHWTKRVKKQWCAYALALVAVFVLLTVAPSAQAQTFTLLHAFAGSPTDGANPYAPLIMDAKGNLYGTTYDGGSADVGTVFEVSNEGKGTILYSFSGASDGALPYAGLVKDAQGDLYGATVYNGGYGYGPGVVFKVTPSGKETILYQFCTQSGCPDGGFPRAGLVMDANGDFYGTTPYGGVYGLGTVFKLTKAGNETVVYSFKGPPDGKYPVGGLVIDAEGNLFGTTAQGGTHYFCCVCPSGVGCGTVFKVTKSGKETVLHSFGSGTKHPAVPMAGLVMDSQGNLYGTTLHGGGRNLGTVFKVTKTGKTTVLYRFKGPDGGLPYAGLVMDGRGNLYGTTSGGGESSTCCGVLFKLNKSGQEVVLHNFTGGTDGASPYASLIMDAKGNLYGTASRGGTAGLGTVYKFTP